MGDPQDGTRQDFASCIARPLMSLFSKKVPEEPNNDCGVCYWIVFIFAYSKLYRMLLEHFFIKLVEF